ncbi:RNA polymerase sigma factor [Enterococcus olivae]
MESSLFQLTVEKQFDFICKRAMKDERIDYLKHLSRISKKEISFSQIEDYVVNQFSVVDTYSIDFKFFKLNGLTIGVENELLGDALESLSEKKRTIILLYYFIEMNDLEISELLSLSRSTVNEHKLNGLAEMKKFIEEHAQ